MLEQTNNLSTKYQFLLSYKVVKLKLNSVYHARCHIFFLPLLSVPNWTWSAQANFTTCTFDVSLIWLWKVEWPLVQKENHFLICVYFIGSFWTNKGKMEITFTMKVLTNYNSPFIWDGDDVDSWGIWCIHTAPHCWFGHVFWALLKFKSLGWCTAMKVHAAVNCMSTKIKSISLLPSTKVASSTMVMNLAIASSATLPLIFLKEIITIIGSVGRDKSW